MTPSDEERHIKHAVGAALALCGLIATYGVVVNLSMGRPGTAVVFALLTAPAAVLLIKKF